MSSAGAALEGAVCACTPSSPNSKPPAEPSIWTLRRCRRIALIDPRSLQVSDGRFGVLLIGIPFLLLNNTIRHVQHSLVYLRLCTERGHSRRVPFYFLEEIYVCGCVSSCAVGPRYRVAIERHKPAQNAAAPPPEKPCRTCQDRLPTAPLFGPHPY